MNRYKISGYVLLALGVGQMVAAAAMNVTLAEQPSVANNDLMFQRELYFLGGGFAFLAGVITLGVDRICRLLGELRPGDLSAGQDAGE